MAIQAREMILCVVLFASSVLLFYGVKSRTPQQLNVNMTATHSKHRTEEDWESDFLGSVSAERARESLRFLSSAPHMASSGNDLRLAEYMKDAMLDAGLLDVQMEPVKALLSYPISRSLSLIEDGEDREEKIAFEAQLEEAVYVEDATSDTMWRKMTYLAYSPSGEATAELVYANYGRIEDFVALNEAGVNVEGKIVLARNSGVYRGLIIFNAEQRGAVGVIIYSDPGDDGFGKGGEYPDKGGWRPRSGVKRGTVLNILRCPGDPSRSAREDATIEDVCEYSQQDLMPSIPALPISWGDALPLLKALRGPIAPESFRGGLNNDSLSILDEYRLGPSTKSVRLRVENRLELSTTWNVIGKIPGSLPEVDDRPVMIGNHRDAWVFGAVDPSSGTSAMLEVIRGFGGLLRRSWMPRRTIYICSWGGEEFGLIGSTAFAEANSDWISKKVLVYLNVDSGASGPHIKVGATPSLIPLWNSTLANVPGIHVSDDNVDAVTAESSSSPPVSTWNGKFAVLGTGSDFTVFLHHLGVPCMAFSMDQNPKKGEMGSYGVYHSIYDSFTWMEKYGDPSFERHVAIARIWGLLALRLADGISVPMDSTVHAKHISYYVDEISHDIDSVIPPALTSGSSHSVEVHAEEMRRQDMKARILTRLKTSVALFTCSAALLMDQARMEQSTTGKISVRTNDALSLYQRQFLTEGGLPERKWFKNVLVAPSLHGYNGSTFPGVRWAIDKLTDEGVSDNGLDILKKHVHIASSRITAAAMYMYAPISLENVLTAKRKLFSDILDHVVNMGGVREEIDE